MYRDRQECPYPCLEQCGEKAYTDEVAAVLETIVTRAREMLTEIAVVNYPEKAA